MQRKECTKRFWENARGLHKAHIFTMRGKPTFYREGDSDEIFGRQGKNSGSWVKKRQYIYGETYNPRHKHGAKLKSGVG